MSLYSTPRQGGWYPSGKNIGGGVARGPPHNPDPQNRPSGTLPGLSSAGIRDRPLVNAG